MRITLIVTILACALALPAEAQIGAKKFKFQASADTNAIVPDFFVNRDFVPLKVLAAVGADLNWFAGRVIYKDGNGDWVFLPVVTKGKPTWMVKVAAVPYSFHSNINREYKGNLNVPVVEISAGMTNAYDYEILDIATINVPDENVPDKATVEAAVAALSLPPTVPVFWITSVTLTTVSVKSAAEVKSGGTITGVGFSTGASTYNASSAAAFTPLAAIATIPMNAAAVTQTLENKKPAPVVPSLVAKEFKPEDKGVTDFARKYESKLTRGGGIISRIKPAVE
jgi:hypothetical protein